MEEVRGGAGGSPDLPHLVDWRHGVYAAQLVMVSASSGSSVGAEATIPKEEDALCSNGCYDAQQAQLVRLYFKEVILGFRELALFFIDVSPSAIISKCRRKAEQVESGPIMGVFQKGFAKSPSELPPC